MKRYSLVDFRRAKQRGELAREGGVLGVHVEGVILEAQFELKDGSGLICLTDDSPYDEGLHIYLRDQNDTIEDAVEAGADFAPGVLRIGHTGDDWMEFEFFSNGRSYRLEVSEKSTSGAECEAIRYLRARRVRAERSLMLTVAVILGLARTMSANSRTRNVSLSPRKKIKKHIRLAREEHCESSSRTEMTTCLIGSQSIGWLSLKRQLYDSQSIFCRYSRPLFLTRAARYTRGTGGGHAGTHFLLQRASSKNTFV